MIHKNWAYHVNHSWVYHGHKITIERAVYMMETSVLTIFLKMLKKDNIFLEY